MTTTPEIRTGARMTLSEFLGLPRQEQRCELIDGVVYMAAFPIPDHRFLAMALSGHMFQQIMETGLGIVYQVAGVPEYWILDGDADTLTLLELADDGAYRERAALTAADTLTTPICPEFSLSLARVFDHPARLPAHD